MTYTKSQVHVSENLLADVLVSAHSALVSLEPDHVDEVSTLVFGDFHLELNHLFLALESVHSYLFKLHSILFEGLDNLSRDHNGFLGGGAVHIEGSLGLSDPLLALLHVPSYH